MSTKDDIDLYFDKKRNPNGDKGLVYTCNCGWIDVGHARPTAARELWHQLINENDRFTQNAIEGFKVTAFENGRKFGMTIQEQRQDFLVSLGLSEAQKQRVALSIFQEVSLNFETLQNTGIVGGFVEWWSKSSFSEEDLVSNLVGFYRAVKGETYDWRNWCKPVSKDASIAVWDKYGPTGNTKNKFFTPNFHSCDECTATPTFPYVYNEIVGMAKGIWHFDFEPDNLVLIVSSPKRGFSQGFGFIDVPREVILIIGENESQYLFSRRALIQAGFLAGLPLLGQIAFANKFYPLDGNMKLNLAVENDPLNKDKDQDKTWSNKEFNTLKGSNVAYVLNPAEYDELKAESKNIFSNASDSFLLK